MSRSAIPLSLDTPMTFTQPLDFTDARDALREAAEQRRQARDWKQRAMQAEAEAERTYRKQRADLWLKAVGDTAKAKEDWVNSESADARFERDVAQRIVKAADERISEVDAERASLHKLVEASMPSIKSGMQDEPPSNLEDRVRRAA